MTWLLVLPAAWVVAAVVAAPVIGRTVHAADVIEHTDDPMTTPAEPRAADVLPVAGPAGSRRPVPREALVER